MVDPRPGLSEAQCLVFVLACLPGRFRSGRIFQSPPSIPTLSRLPPELILRGRMNCYNLADVEASDLAKLGFPNALVFLAQKRALLLELIAEAFRSSSRDLPSFPSRFLYILLFPTLSYWFHMSPTLSSVHKIYS